MMSQMAKDCRLPDSALPAHLDGKTCVECGEHRGQIRLTIEKAPNRPRLAEDRRGARPKLRLIGAQSLTNHGAARVADLERYNALPLFAAMIPPDMDAVA